MKAVTILSLAVGAIGGIVLAFVFGSMALDQNPQDEFWGCADKVRQGTETLYLNCSYTSEWYLALASFFAVGFVPPFILALLIGASLRMAIVRRGGRER